ncbi:MAG TPA: ABC transporter substrate-binding protein [Rhodospirillales bacterium]|nr:ABC transporter substrate-binding protein [Rhodospirillales bacterium]
MIAAAALFAAPALAQPEHAIAMHGSPKYGPDFKNFDYVNPNAPKGGSVKLAATGSFDSFNGFIIKGEAAVGLGRLYDTLLTSSADEAFTAYGLLAGSVETPEDRSWVQFVLRPEARWHDGKPITADDVIWTFETLLKKGEPSYRYYYADVARVEKIDQRTVKFVFKNNRNRELPLIIGQMVVLPKHYWQGKDFARTTLEPPLGSGPYKIDGFEAGRFVSYSRVKDYWGSKVPVNVGQDNFDTIRYDYYRDATVQVEAFKAGEFDYRAENISKVWATAYEIPAVEKGLIKKIEVRHNRTSGMQGFVYNTRRELFKDPLVRQALATAFDFEWSNRTLFYGQYTRSRSYFDNSELATTGLPQGDELKILEAYRGRIPDQVFTTEYNPPKTKGDGRIRSNLRQGDKLLKQAGWVIKDNLRVRPATGQKMEFEILLVSPAFERITLPFVKNLERLGVRARVRTVDSAQYLRRLETFDYDMLVFAWGQSQSPGNEQLGYWGSAAARQNGSRNFAGVNDPVIDELIAGLIAAPDRQSLIARTRALDRVLQWGFYVIPHWYLSYDRLVFWNKFDRPKITASGGSQFSTWWINTDAARSTTEGLKTLKGN